VSNAVLERSQFVGTDQIALADEDLVGKTDLAPRLLARVQRLVGMFGVDGFTPVINPPNTAILGVGRLRDDVVVSKKGKVSTVKRMTLSLTWDHRVFDGAPAAEFCKSIVDLLADPSALNK
jgi:hypothetical protein